MAFTSLGEWAVFLGLGVTLGRDVSALWILISRAGHQAHDWGFSAVVLS